MSPTLSIELVNQRSEIPRLADIAFRFGRAHQLPEDDVANIQLVLDEMVINVIRHGYEDVGDRDRHHIHISLTLDGGLLTIQLRDRARASIRARRRRRDSICRSRSEAPAGWASTS